MGVLTLCDNPFAVDCGHNHNDASSGLFVDSLDAYPICASEEQSEGDLSTMWPTVIPGVELTESHSTAQDTSASDAQICHPGRSEELSVSQSTFALSADSSMSQMLQNPSSTIASTGASNGADDAVLSTASSGETRIVVEDEGLYRHEYATILAEVRAGISRVELNGLVAAAGGLIADNATDEDLAYGLVRLSITDGTTVLQAIDRVLKTAGFINAQPNYVYCADDVSAHTVINDRYRSRLWGLDSVDAYAAWDIAKTQNSVSVAVIDTGADLDHPDLASNIIATRNAYSAVNTVEDAMGHGSHVAGIISGVANNSTGVAGVSYNANLVIIKAAAYKSNDFDTASIVRAYAWLESLDSTGRTVAEHYNVRVVNLSVGGLDKTRAANSRDDALVNAMTKARDEFGILTVVSAGNGSSSGLPFLAYPGDSDACLSVMNLAQVEDEETGASTLTLHETSNYNVSGTCYKDLCAPGSSITSAWLNGGYAISTGTSMAAPMVAGIAAMLFAVNPYLTPQMVMSILEVTATDLGDEGWDEMYGYGEVNAAAAVRLASASRIDGFRVVGVGGSAGYTASLGLDLQEEGDRTWTVWKGTGSAAVDENGVLTGVRAGEVTLVSTCKATTGAEITAIKTVYVLDGNIVGDSVVSVGSVSSEYKTTNTSWTWVWQVENGTGSAHIDQDAILVADEPGFVYVTATCASNTDIVFRKRVTIVA